MEPVACVNGIVIGTARQPKDFFPTLELHWTVVHHKMLSCQSDIGVGFAQVRFEPHNLIGIGVNPGASFERDRKRAPVNAVAPELFNERRAELEELARRNDRRGWKFWKR